ncbi:MAG TPA: DM13 domain-containing protein [Bacteroidia bacterium]|jgi:hypothetical protein|nr:DM13 domain-containing protein [Bacteroidia bacterium]
MKIALLLLAVAIGSAACRKERNLGPKEDIEVQVSDTIPVLKYAGTFSSGPYGKVLGEGRIYKQNNKYFLLLTNFKSSNGSGLHVYLSKEKTPVNYYDVGSLKSFNEPQRYEIEADLDNMPYGYICVHCVDQNHLFGWAKL